MSQKSFRTIRLTLLASLTFLLVAAIACQSGDSDEDGDDVLGEIGTELTTEWIEGSVPGLSAKLEQVNPRRRQLQVLFSPRFEFDYAPKEHSREGANSALIYVSTKASGAVGDFNDPDDNDPYQFASVKREPKSISERVGFVCRKPGPGTYTVTVVAKIGMASAENPFPHSNVALEPERLTLTGSVECFTDQVAEATETAASSVETPVTNPTETPESDPVEIEYFTLAGERWPVTQFEVAGSDGVTTGRIGRIGDQIFITVDNPEFDNWALPDQVDEELEQRPDLRVESGQIPRADWDRYCDAVLDAYKIGLTNTATEEACKIETSLESSLPVAVPVGTGGIDGSYEVLIIGGNSYPAEQFSHEVFGTSVVFSAEPGQLIFSFDAPGQPIVDVGTFIINPNPDLFGDATEVQLDTIEIADSEIVPFCETVSEQTSPDLAHYSPIRDFCDEGLEPNPIPARPTATPATRGVLVEVIKIDDAHYYRHIMEEIGNPAAYNCGGEYSMHIAAPYTVAIPFEYPTEPKPDPDPTGCGFGRTALFSVDGLVVRDNGVIKPEFLEVRFTAKVIGEWCRAMKWDTEPQVRAVENLCQRNPPQD